ncbi:MAG: glycosyltransferase family 2 protein [Phycisphaeraceae bacterium]|nr:glycosyltransferase family 2 protein [Phycisphaeraceae bacterium]
MHHLRAWADAIYVLDTGSTDQSWEIVHKHAAIDSRVVPLERRPVVFLDALRAYMIERVRDRLRPGDWIARVDADEFYPVPPPEFIRQCLRPHESFIVAQMYDYVLRRADLLAWRLGAESLADRARPIADRRRYCIINHYPEPRFWKYRRGMRWPLGLPHPAEPGVTAQARIPIRHYRWRDPVQAQWRFALRRTMRPYMLRAGGHWNMRHWTHRVWNDDDPALHLAPLGVELPAVADNTHLPPSRALRRATVRQRLGIAQIRDCLRPRLDLDKVLILMPPEFDRDFARRLAQWPPEWADLAAPAHHPPPSARPG